MVSGQAERVTMCWSPTMRSPSPSVSTLFFQDWGRDDLLVMPAPALLRHAIMQPASAAHLSHTVVRLILLKVPLSPSLLHGR